METYSNLYSSICRVCLSYGNKENMVCLIDDSSEDSLSCYGKSVVVFANISINIKDKLPKYMCSNCLKILKYAIYFKLKCESSNKQLKQLVKIHKESGTNLKESIVDYLMFTQYFPQEANKKTSSAKSKGNTKHLYQEKSQKRSKTPENSTFDNDDIEIQFVIDPDKDNDRDSVDEGLDLLEELVTQSSAVPDEDIDEDISDNEADSDSVDKGLDLLEQLVSKSSSDVPSTSYTFPEKHRVINKRKYHENKLMLSQKMLKCKKLLARRTDKNSPKKYECHICQKELANQHTYNYHMERHTGCKFICEHCGKGFPVLVEMHMHQVVRHGTGPSLPCPHCPYKAPRKHNLVEHIRLHTGERPYTCDKCGLTFRRKAIWKKHMVHHKEKTVQCPRCPKKFYLRSELTAHINSIHERLYVYVCHMCDTTYAKTETVRRHLVEKHGIPRDKQGKIVRINKGKGMSFPEQ